MERAEELKEKGVEVHFLLERPPFRGTIVDDKWLISILFPYREEGDGDVSRYYLVSRDESMIEVYKHSLNLLRIRPFLPTKYRVQISPSVYKLLKTVAERPKYSLQLMNEGVDYRAILRALSLGLIERERKEGRTYYKLTKAGREVVNASLTILPKLRPYLMMLPASLRSSAEDVLKMCPPIYKHLIDEILNCEKEEGYFKFLKLLYELSWSPRIKYLIIKEGRRRVKSIRELAERMGINPHSLYLSYYRGQRS